LKQIQPGQNIALEQLRFSANVTWMPGETPLTLDPSAYLLGQNGKVASDAGFLFYGQSDVAGGAATLDAASARFSFDLARLPADTERVALALTIEQGVRRGQQFSHLRQLVLTVKGDSEPIEFTLDTGAMTETAVILGEFYRRNGAWKFRAVGQGFRGGLGPLASHFGVEISDDPDQAPPTAAPAPPPVRLQKITLDKKTPVSLDKRGGHFGEISVNLNWSRQPLGEGAGWNPFRKDTSTGIDLDLGCMLEHKNGDKLVIQALGKRFGSFESAPWVQLMGDDRTGAASDGENLRINGAHWSDFKRILLFAFIYEGIPNWAAADAVVTIKSPGQPELTVKLDSPAARQGMCAVAMLENDGGRIRITKLADYHTGHKELDQAHQFGFRWTTGSK
jgi:tellurite resistance protein TerA